jgi:hypothetical protein
VRPATIHRLSSRPANPPRRAAPLRYLVLLRESVGHFNLLTWSPPGAAAGPAGQIGAFTFGEGRGEPEVVRVLWGVPPL